MERENRMTTGTQNPAKQFFQWKSKHQKFAYYDKVDAVNKFVEFPFKFLALSRYKTVKGWNQKKEGSIISNEVKDLKDQFIVNFYPKSGEKLEIAKGNWSEVKETVDLWDGRYTESVYIMLENGDVANIQINGAGLSTWFEFQKNQTDRFFNDWVIVSGFKEGVKGDVTYTFPVFEWGTSLNKDAQQLADYADGKIGEYEKGYFGKQEELAPKVGRNEVDAYEGRQETPPSEADSAIAILDDKYDEMDIGDSPF